MNYTIIVLENGLSSIRRQDIFCTHAGLCLCWGKFQYIGLKLQQFSYKKSILKWRLQSSGLEDGQIITST